VWKVKPMQYSEFLFAKQHNSIISMGFASLNIHVEIHKIHIEGDAIPIGNLNLFFNLFSITKISKLESIFV
jgi:hypothetical protein